MAINLGTAWVDIVPSTNSLAKELRGQTDPIFRDVGRDAGNSLTGNFTRSMLSGLDSVGGQITETVTRWFRRGATVGIAAVAGVAAVGLTRGLNRVLDTEDARVQLGRMGLELGQINTLLGAVDDTFSGTPFANPDGFNISSQLFASGVELDKIPGILGTIADLSAHGNVPIEQMGALFVRAASEGRVMGDGLNRLSDANIPLATLADTLGVTVGELRDMASAGELTADMFFDGLAQVEMFEGAAKAAGDTTRGAWSNVWTAIGVMGEKFLTPLFGENGTMVTMLKTVREGIRGLFPTIERWGEAFADWVVPAAQDLVEWFRGPFVDALERVQQLMSDGLAFYRENEAEIHRIARAVGVATVALGGLAVAVHIVGRAIALTPIGLVLALASGLVYAWQNSERFREVVTGAFEAVRDTVGPIIETVRGWLDGLFSGGGGGSGFLSTMQSVWGQVQTVIGDFIGWLQAHVWPIVESYADLWVAVVERIRDIISAVTPVIEALWDKFGGRILDILENVWETVKGVVEGALLVVRGIIETITGLISGDWGRAWDGIKLILEGVWTLITTIVSGSLTHIQNLLKLGWDIMKAAASAAWDLITSAVSAALTRIVNLVRELPGNVVDALGSLYGVGRQFITGLWDGIWERMQSVIAWFQGLPGRIYDWALGQVGMLVQLGTMIVSNIVAGIQAIAGAITAAVLNALPTGAQIAARIASNAQSVGIPLSPGASAGIKGIFGLAKGTDYWRGGVTWVGEEGPELVNLPRGAQVFPHRESMAMASGAASGPRVGMHVENATFESGLDLETSMRTLNLMMTAS